MPTLVEYNEQTYDLVTRLCGRSPYTRKVVKSFTKTIWVAFPDDSRRYLILTSLTAVRRFKTKYGAENIIR